MLHGMTKPLGGVGLLWLCGCWQLELVLPLVPWGGDSEKGEGC